MNASEIDELLHAFTLDANEAREALGAALALTQPPPLTPAFFQGSAKRAVGGLESILAGGVAKVSAYFPPWLSPRKVQVDSPAHAPANLQDVKRQWLPQQLSLVRTVLDNLVSEHADSTASDHDSFLMEGVRSSTLDRWGCAEAFGIALRVLSSPSSNGLMLVGQKSLLQGFDNPAVQVATLAAKASGCKPILIQALQAMPAPLMVAQQIRDVLDQHPNYVKDPPIALIITPSAADDLVTMELLNRLLTWPSQVAASISTSDGIDPTVCSYGTSYSHAYVSNMADILLHSQFKAKVDDATRRSSMRRSESQNGMSSSHSTPRSAGQENTADDEAALHSESTNRPSHRPSLINNGVDSGAFLRPALEGHRHGLGFALSRVEASRSERIKRAGALADIAQALKKGLKIIVVAGSSSQATRLQQSFPALFHRTSSHLPPGSDNVTSTCWISVSISADGGDQIPKETKASRIGVALGAVAPFVSAVLAVSQADRPSATSSSPVPLIDTSFVNSASNLDATGAAETMLRQARLRLSSALETIHDRTQSLFVDKRLLRVDAPLPESMIYDLAVALESIHNAQYKGLRARRAELSSVLSKLSKGKASNVRGPSPAKALETKVQVGTASSTC